MPDNYTKLAIGKLFVYIPDYFDHNCIKLFLYSSSELCEILNLMGKV